MKNLLYFLPALLLFGCSGDSLPTQHSETIDNIQFRFEAHYTDKWNTEIRVDVELKNLSKDTMCFYISSCNDWIGLPDLKTDNLDSPKDARQCLDTVPIIAQIAPSETRISSFSYSLYDDSPIKTIQFTSICFGLRCYPVKKNEVTVLNLQKYLKNQKTIQFKPTTVKIN